MAKKIINVPQVGEVVVDVETPDAPQAPARAPDGRVLAAGVQAVAKLREAMPAPAEGRRLYEVGLAHVGPAVVEAASELDAWAAYKRAWGIVKSDFAPTVTEIVADAEPAEGAE